MCWCFPFGLSNKQKPKSTSSTEKKPRRPPSNPLRGDGVPVAAEYHEKRRSRETTRSKRSKESVTPTPSRREYVERRARREPQQRNTHRARVQNRPALNVQVPNMWHRTVHPGSSHSSQETLLNPRPHRSPHERQRHPKHTSQGTLRGRGAKRDPPRHSNSKRDMRQDTSAQAWSLFASPPPKAGSRGARHYQTVDSAPPRHRASRAYPPPTNHTDAPQPSQSHNRHHRTSGQHERQPSSRRSARSRTPNMAAHRTPDRRFAVLAATNQALEDLRREAFAHPSPPPRRERVQQYHGFAIPTSTIPFNWDCVSSSQTSGGYGEPSTTRRRSRR
ncbi:uncharacterized protein EI97DRAFT_303433 [Westerdykella ornata]|uniref:Uncharacterized protein n=1 Tax=Westerdykella ornata TaxID=318751 RepID=A0A6A6J5J0_WESOR|nr:uncharacterized protein EI97DRAFT_303433 [Westerdykella ornata]KAF2271238.1 hypothetical protein EI97DRAFT_303433 [Westerdykella ornata]